MREYRIMRVYDGTQIPMSQDRSGQWWWKPPFDDRRGPYLTAEACEDAVVEWVLATETSHTGDTE